MLINGVVVGISSFRGGRQCEPVEGKYPNVYTDVSYYVSLLTKLNACKRMFHLSIVDKLDRNSHWNRLPVELVFAKNNLKDKLR